MPPLYPSLDAYTAGCVEIEPRHVMLGSNRVAIYPRKVRDRVIHSGMHAVAEGDTYPSAKPRCHGPMPHRYRVLPEACSKFRFAMQLRSGPPLRKLTLILLGIKAKCAVAACTKLIASQT